MIKLINVKTGCTNMIKVKFIRNDRFLGAANNSSEPLIFTKHEALGIVDLRFIGYYNMKQCIKQYHLKPYYKFKPLQVLCKEFNKLTNTLREVHHSNDPYLWLAEDTERRNLTEREILEKYADLGNSCLNQK